jgi:hypothetical protein
MSEHFNCSRIFYSRTGVLPVSPSPPELCLCVHPVEEDWSRHSAPDWEASVRTVVTLEFLITEWAFCGAIKALTRPIWPEAFPFNTFTHSESQSNVHQINESAIKSSNAQKTHPVWDWFKLPNHSQSSCLPHNCFPLVNSCLLRKCLVCRHHKPWLRVVFYVSAKFADITNLG